MDQQHPPTPLETTVPRTSRRRFLAWSGVAAAGVTAAGVGGTLTWQQLQHRAQTTPLAPHDAVLVVITLYGGNDGLDTVVPAGDAAYQQARPGIALPPDKVLDLGDGLGLNPGLKGLKGLWDAKRVAVVRGVGYPRPDHSHFRSMAIWQTADPERPQPTGWLGRWLDTTGDPLHALSLDPVLPPLLAGGKTSAVTCPAKGLRLGTGQLGDALVALGTPDGADLPLVADAARAYADLQRASGVVNPAVEKQKEEAQASGPAAGTATGGADNLREQLALAATMIEMGLPTRVYSASLGGFDTHAGEPAAHEALLTHLDEALTDFQRRIDARGLGARVVTVVYSEFGRRVRANASQGTDHGTAGPMFVLGDAVKAGFHGDQPSLTDLDDGDLKVTVDFREVYAALLHRVLGADPAQHLGGWSKELDLLS